MFGKKLKKKPSAESLTAPETIPLINLTEMEQIVNEIKLLHAQVASMQNQIVALDRTPRVQQYTEVSVNVTDVKEISLDMFKTLPEFNGDRNRYSAWRGSAINVMKIFIRFENTPKYFEALNILRNKIVGTASDVLTNYNTVFNFEAIINRLDFTYADKRPVYIIEQELIVLQQRHLSIEDFYDEVNKKLNALLNKINMTHKERAAATAMIQDASEKALRTFITGLKGNFGQMLYASNPATLPDAYAKLQTIINDQERIKFANQYNSPQVRNNWNENNANSRSHYQNNSNARPQHQNNKQNQPQHQKREASRINPNFKPTSFQKTINRNTGVVPMEIDHSSMKVNAPPNTGAYSGQNSRFVDRKRFQRVNQLENEEDEDENENEDERAEDECDQGDSDSCETSSVFLDK